jgi:glycerol-3-phosphate acyltransferase PlsY
MIALLIIALAFALGSIPFGVVIARQRGVDLQQRGSGNIGASNATRVLGLRVGAFVLLCDAGKGAIPTAFALHTEEPWLVVVTAFAAILGHCFSPWLRGRGGKGVATAFGAFLVLEPALAGIAAAMFVVVLLRTKTPALGSLSGMALLVALAVGSGDGPLVTLAIATFVLMLYTHRTNLAALR